MPTFVNENPTASRVVNPDTGKSVRILSGQTIEADGAFADALEGTTGMETADSGQEEAWQERVQQNNAAGLSDGPALRAQSKGLIGPMRQQLRQATIAGPLRVVVGDTQAPYGPDNGTMTTKAQAAQESPEDRRAFADHEALPGERVEGAGEVGAEGEQLAGARDYRSAEIHNSQETNANVAEEAAQAYIEGVPALTPRSSGGPEAQQTGASGGWDERSEQEKTDEALAQEREAQGGGLEPPYDQYSATELKAEAGRRGEPVGGTKQELVTRLEESDAQ